MLSSVKAILFDLSGVVWEGDTRLEGADETISAARSAGYTLRFVTNTATRSRSDLLRKLERMEIPMEEDELFTAPMAAHRYLESAGLRPFLLVHEAIREEFDDLSQDDPNAVVLGDARGDLHYDSLNQAFRLCHDGAKLIGIGMNRYFKEGGELSLDAGPFIRALEWAADTEATIMGKPSEAFFEQVVASTGVGAGNCLMIGDDIEGDVVGAVEAGLQGLLVRTGKYQEGDEERLPEGAEIVDSIADLLSEIG